MAQNWWEAYPTSSAQAAPAGVIQGPPRLPTPQTPAQAALDEQQLINARLEAQNKQQELEQGGRRGLKQIPDGAAKRLEDQVSSVANFERAVESFNPEFSGLGSGIENTAQSYVSSVGTPGQRDWWADFKLTDAALRNALFGASLTESEKQAFEQTTVSPSMAPEIIKQNLARRRELAREVLGRRSKFMKANRYDPEAVSALMGEYDPDAAPAPVPPSSAPAPGRLSDEEYMVQLDRLVKAGDRVAIDQFMAEQGATEKTPGQIDAAIKAGAGKVLPPETAGPSMLEQLGQSTLNVGAGLVEGAGSILDATAQAVGNVIAIPADILGFEEVADQWRNPYGISDAVGDAVPVPNDTGGWLARQGARLTGGVAALPRSLGNALTQSIAGRPPPTLPPTRNALLPDNAQLGQDLTALKINPTMAATGGPIARAATTATAASPTGARPIVQGTRRMVDEGGRALQRIAGREGGNIANPELAGETARRGALSFRDISRAKIGSIYDDAGREAQGATILPERAIQKLDEHIKYFDQVPGGVESANYIKSLQGELVKRRFDGVTVEGVRGMRTVLRDKFFKDGLRGSDIERRVNEVVDSISDDLTASLTEQGKSKAASLFKQADQAWKERIATLDEVIMPIIGKRGEKSGEQIVQSLQSASRGHGRRFDKFLRSLPPEDAAEVRATLIDSIGKAKAGGQNAAGDAFSFDTFLTNWNQMSSGTARRALFSDKDASALESLARVSERVKAAGKFTNYSQSGLAAVGGATGYGLWADPVSALAFLGGSYAVGKVLASPGAARALLRISSAKSPGAAKARVKELSTVATRNPAAANDILDLQNRLMGMIQSPATAAAAEEQK